MVASAISKANYVQHNLCLLLEVVLLSKYSHHQQLAETKVGNGTRWRFCYATF